MHTPTFPRFDFKTRVILAVSALVVVSVPVVWFLTARPSKSIVIKAIFPIQEAADPLGLDAELQLEHTYRKSFQQHEKLDRTIDELHRKYHQRNLELLTRFEIELHAAVSGPMAQARATIPQVVEGIAGSGVLKTLIDANFRDEAFGARVNQVMERTIMPFLTQAYGGSLNLLENYRLRLRENRNQYLSELAQVAAPSIENPVSTRFLDQFGKEARPGQFVLDQAGKTNWSLLALVAGPTLFGESIKSELLALRNLALKTVKLIAKRLAKRGLISGILAVADGPLPIGDVIGGVLLVGGVASTTHDLYEMKQQVPRDMEANLRKAVDRYEQSLLTILVEQAQADQSGWMKLQGQVHNQLDQEMNQE